MVKISIDQEKCVGCGLCESCSPDLFKLDTRQFKAKLKQKENLVEALLLDLSTEQLEEITQVIRGCPIQAIKLSK